LLVFDAELHDCVVISASEEGSLVLEHLKTPSFSIVVRIMNSGPVCAIDVDSLDSAIVVTDQDFAVQKIERGSEMICFKRNLSQKLIFTSFT